MDATTAQTLTNPAAHAAALWAGLNLLLLLVLSLLVVRQRRKHKVTYEHGDVDELKQAQRAFGNAIEYVPAVLAGLAVLATVGASAALVHVLGGGLFFARVIHAVGLSRSTGVTTGRLVGTGLTWIVYLVAATALLFYAVP